MMRNNNQSFHSTRKPDFANSMIKSLLQTKQQSPKHHRNKAKDNFFSFQASTNGNKTTLFEEEASEGVLQLPRNSVMFYAPNKHEPLKFVKAEDLSVEQLNDLILKQIPQNT